MAKDKAVSVADTPQPSPPKKRTPLLQFFREVRAEGRKITWTTWGETWVTSIMVFIMVVVAALFFLVVDQLLAWIVQFLLSIGG